MSDSNRTVGSITPASILADPEVKAMFASLEKRIEDPAYKASVEKFHQQQIAREADERRPRLVNERWIPELFVDRLLLGLGASPRHVLPSLALDTAMQFLDDQEKNILVLAGVTESGKSLAAAWLVAHPQVSTGLFVHVSQIERANKFSDEEWSRLERAQVLAIDDLGTEYLDRKGAFNSRFDALMTQRHAQRRKTAITTNLPPIDLTGRYGDRFARRVADDGRVVTFPRRWRDR